MAIVSAAPALKPSKIVSLIKLTSPLKRNSQASPDRPATTSAESAAMAIQRDESPSAMPATVLPTKRAIAEVGPIANCREVPNTA